MQKNIKGKLAVYEKTNGVDNILGADIFVATVLVQQAVSKKERYLAFWQYVWKAFCRQSQVFLPILQESRKRGGDSSDLD